MDINAIGQYITAYGFPIVWTFILGWFIVKKLDANTESNKELAELIKEALLRQDRTDKGGEAG